MSQIPQALSPPLGNPAVFSRVIYTKYLMDSPLHSFKSSNNQRGWDPQGAGYKIFLGFGGKTEKGRGNLHCPEVLMEEGLGSGERKRKAGMNGERGLGSSLN